MEINNKNLKHSIKSNFKILLKNNSKLSSRNKVITSESIQIIDMIVTTFGYDSDKIFDILFNIKQNIVDSNHFVLKKVINQTAFEGMLELLFLGLLLDISFAFMSPYSFMNKYFINKRNIIEVFIDMVNVKIIVNIKPKKISLFPEIKDIIMLLHEYIYQSVKSSNYMFLPYFSPFSNLDIEIYSKKIIKSKKEFDIFTKRCYNKHTNICSNELYYNENITYSYDIDGISGCFNLSDIDNIFKSAFELHCVNINIYKICSKKHFVYLNDGFYNIKNLCYKYLGYFNTIWGQLPMFILSSTHNFSENQYHSFSYLVDGIIANTIADLKHICKGCRANRQLIKEKVITIPIDVLKIIFNNIISNKELMKHKPFLFVEKYNIKSYLSSSSIHVLFINIQQSICLDSFHHVKFDVCKSILLKDQKCPNLVGFDKDVINQLPGITYSPLWLDSISNYNKEYFYLTSKKCVHMEFEFFEKLNLYNTFIKEIVPNIILKKNYPVFSYYYILNELLGNGKAKYNLFRYMKILHKISKNISNLKTNSFEYRIELRCGLFDIFSAIAFFDIFLLGEKIEIKDTYSVCTFILKCVDYVTSLLNSSINSILKFSSLIIYEVFLANILFKGGNEISVLPSRFKTIFLNIKNLKNDMLDLNLNLFNYEISFDEFRIILKRFIRMSKFIHDKEYYIGFLSNFTLNINNIANTIEYIFINDMLVLYHSNKTIITQYEYLDSTYIISKYNPSYKEYYKDLFHLKSGNPLYTRNFMFMIRLVTKFGYISINNLINEIAEVSRNNQYYLLFNLNIQSIKKITKKRYVKIMVAGITDLEFSKLSSLINSEIKCSYENLHNKTWESRRLNYTSEDCGRVLHGMNKYQNSYKIWDSILCDIRYGFTFICTTSQIREIYRRYQRGKNICFNNMADDEKNDFNPQDTTVECIIEIIYRVTKGVILSSESLLNIKKLLYNEKLKNEIYIKNDRNNIEQDMQTNQSSLYNYDLKEMVKTEYEFSNDIENNPILFSMLDANYTNVWPSNESDSKYNNDIDKGININVASDLSNIDNLNSTCDKLNSGLIHNISIDYNNNDIQTSDEIFTQSNKKIKIDNVSYVILTEKEKKLYNKLLQKFNKDDLIYPHILRRNYYCSKYRPLINDLIFLLNSLVIKDKLTKHEDDDIYILK